MNCKQGDLAIVVFSHCGNEGRIVRCIRMLRWDEKAELGFDPSWPMWEVDTCLMDTWGDESRTAVDAYLRPIRDSEGDDETLTWVGRPEEVTA